MSDRRLLRTDGRNEIAFYWVSFVLELINFVTFL